VGETVTVYPKLLPQGPELSLQGVVVYHVPSLGFAVQFWCEPERLEQLREEIGRLPDKR
jgi:hypothetical protein